MTIARKVNFGLDVLSLGKLLQQALAHFLGFYQIFEQASRFHHVPFIDIVPSKRFISIRVGYSFLLDITSSLNNSYKKIPSPDNLSTRANLQPLTLIRTTNGKIVCKET